MHKWKEYKFASLESTIRTVLSKEHFNDSQAKYLYDMYEALETMKEAQQTLEESYRSLAYSLWEENRGDEM